MLLYSNELLSKCDRYINKKRLHIITVEILGGFIMNVTNTYLNNELQKRLDKQAELHRKCILILQSSDERR